MKSFFKQTENIMTVKILSLGFIALMFIIIINSCKHEPPMVPDTGNPEVLMVYRVQQAECAVQIRFISPMKFYR